MLGLFDKGGVPDATQIAAEQARANRVGVEGPTGGFEYGYYDDTGTFRAGFSPDHPQTVRQRFEPHQAALYDQRALAGAQVETGLLAALLGAGAPTLAGGRDAIPQQGWMGLLGVRPPKANTKRAKQPKKKAGAASGAGPGDVQGYSGGPDNGRDNVGGPGFGDSPGFGIGGLW